MPNERDVPKKYTGLYDKCKKSRKAAIRSFCVECVGYVSFEVIKCTDKGCPLYSWRKTG